MNTQPFFPNDLLIQWFEAQKRALPWRENPTPYRVWVSEVMLQQTRANVVVEYFARWMARFPDIESLAKAPIEEVIKAWEGLGYYSRARNLHRGAQQCLSSFGGTLPKDEEELLSIKGIGPYTVAALLNFAFRRKKALLDGNVLRVMSRFFAIQESIDTSQVYAHIKGLIEGFLPEKKFWIVSEALMELGAVICGKNPRCPLCPVQAHCQARQKGIETLLPIRKERKKIVTLKRVVAFVIMDGKVAITKGEEGKIMAGLYEFPYLEIDSEQEGIAHFAQQWEYYSPLCETKQFFTHYKVFLYAHLFSAKTKDAKWIWVDKDKLLELPFSSGHRRILESYFENIT